MTSTRLLWFFFFQAEDGIRDGRVTGVQTCALPILPDLAKQGVRVRFIGRRDRAPAELEEMMSDLEAETASNGRLDLWIAFDYGGRAELADAARRLVEAG